MTPHQIAVQHAGEALNRGELRAAVLACEALLHADAADVAARHLRGRCWAAAGRIDLAAGEFRRALEIEPNHFAALADLGVAHAALGQYRQGIVVLAAALTQDHRAAELHFALGQCLLGCADFEAAAVSFRRAIECRPAFADAFNNLGVVLDRLGDGAGAIRHFATACALQPAVTRAHRNLAAALARAGRAADALLALQRAATLMPNDAELLCELTEAFLDAGQADAAREAACAAVAVAPQRAHVHATHGMALLGARQLALAVQSLERALALDPTLAYAAVNLGEALSQLDRHEEAASAYRRALAVEADLYQGHLGLGKVLAARGGAAGAAACFCSAYGCRRGDAATAISVASLLDDLGRGDQAAIVLNDAVHAGPADARVHHALGTLLHRRGRLADALASYANALAIDPRHLRAWVDRGHAQESHGQPRDAIASFESALQLQSDLPEAIAGLASCAFRLCDWGQIESMSVRLSAIPNGFDALHPFLLLAAGMRPAQQLRLAQRRAERIASEASVTAVQSHAHDRLRIAYLSPDFREHPVAHAIAAVIDRHDPSRVQSLGVSLAAADGSAVGARLRSSFEVVLDASSLSDRDVVARLRDLEVDIAVDLAGYTAGARPAIFAARCAPVQINYLGFPASMGAAFMDYIIADTVVLPECEDAAYAERVLRLPHCYLPLDRRRPIAELPDRAAAGLQSAGVVFCAFANSYKITRDAFRVWMGLLQDVPESVLWLRSMHEEAAGNLTCAAADQGIPPARLIFAPHIERMDEHLARLQLADIFLDTTPYNAHTTAGDALLAGVPVVSYRGESFAGRVGASLLTAAGLGDLICENWTDYRRKAQRLASAPAELLNVRRRLIAARAEAPMFDIECYTRALEALYFAIAT